MRVVIDIDENVFTRLFDNGTEDYQIAIDDLFAIAKAIRNGTPLPKGHGKLKDTNAIRQEILRREYSNSFCEEHHIDHSINTEIALSVIDNALPIIEADGEAE